MGDPPDIDPYAHAVESVTRGTSSCHLVRHEDRYYAWLAGADGSPLVYPMASEAATLGFLDDWQATSLLHTRWDEMVVHIFLLDPGQGPQNADTPGGGSAAGARIIYHSAVIDVEGDGIWVASYEDTANGHDGGDHHGVCMAARFTDLGPGLHAFAARASKPPAASSASGSAPSRTWLPGCCATGRPRPALRPPGPRWATPSAAASGSFAPPGPSALWPARSASPASSCTGCWPGMSGPGPTARAPARPARGCRTHR